MDRQDELRTPPPISGRDIARVVRRRWPLMAATFLVVPLATTFLTSRMHSVYEARARLLIESAAAGAAVPPGLSGFFVGVATSPLDIELEKMKSRDFLTQVAKEAKVTASSDELLGRVTCTVKGTAPIIEIQVRAASGKEAADLANAVPTVYRRYVDREADARSGLTSRKLHEGIRALKRQKDAATRDVEALSRQMGISDPGVVFSARAAKTAQTRSDLEEARTQSGILESSLAEAQRQMAALRPQKFIVTGYPQQKNPLLDAIPNQINAKLAERKLLLDDFDQDSPEVKHLDAELQALKGELVRAQKESYSIGSKGLALNPDFAAAQTRYWSLQQDRQSNARRILEKQKQLIVLESEQRRLAQQRSRYEQLKRTEGSMTALYEEARTGETRAETARITRLPNIRSLDRAQVPGAPISPNPKLNLALALVLGALLSMAVGLLAEYLTPPVPAPDSGEPTLGLPTVGGVPLLGVAPAAALPPRALRGAPSLVVGGARAEDALREIGYTLAHREPGQPAPVALLIGTRTDDATAALSAYLTALLLRDGLRITLVDADRMQPRLHHVFGKPDAPGLADALTGRKPIGTLLHRTDGGHFRFLAAGDPDDPQPMTQESLGRVFAELARTDDTDLVLVCGPSVWNARSVGPLEKAAGGMVLVASPDVPAEESVARARRLLSNGTAPRIHGVVVGEQPALPPAPSVDVLS